MQPYPKAHLLPGIQLKSYYSDEFLAPNVENCVRSIWSLNTWFRKARLWICPFGLNFRAHISLVQVPKESQKRYLCLN